MSRNWPGRGPGVRSKEYKRKKFAGKRDPKNTGKLSKSSIHFCQRASQGVSVTLGKTTP
jgi:hypothetical protein